MEVCHSPQQSNGTSYGAMFVAIITVETFAGLWINAFLVCVISIAWVKKKILNSSEKILLLLGCSRFCFLGSSWVYSFLSIIYPNYFNVHPTLQLILSFQSFFNYSNLWISACLCGFYCIKIANFRNSYFIYLKTKIDRIVPCLLLGSVLSALAIVITAYYIAVNVQDSNNFTCLGNFWEASIRMDKYLFPLYFLVGVEYAAPFIAVIFSAVFLLFSLWRHKHKMQTNSMNSFSMDAHIKAMKSILSFLVMYSINFVCLISTIIYTKKNENTIMLPISIYLYAFPGVHSFILIFSNPKLEKAVIRIVSCVKGKIFMK